MVICATDAFPHPPSGVEPLIPGAVIKVHADTKAAFELFIRDAAEAGFRRQQLAEVITHRVLCWIATFRRMRPGNATGELIENPATTCLESFRRGVGAIRFKSFGENEDFHARLFAPGAGEKYAASKRFVVLEAVFLV